MKHTKLLTAIAALSVAAAISVGIAGCGSQFEPKGETNGITETTILVGNTAATTGASAKFGEPFNIGLQAALKAYNDAGGYKYKDENGADKSRIVEFTHYDDRGIAADSVTLTEKLVFEDKVFAVVGDFVSECVKANIGTLKEETVPMVYAGSGINELWSDKAENEMRYMFPVQPLNVTEGEVMLLRAFAPGTPETTGGFAATKVGIISNTNEASIGMVNGVDRAKPSLTEAQRNSIVEQKVTTEDYSSAVAALKAANCDVVIIATAQDAFMSILTAMKNANYNAKVLSSYNNASVDNVSDASVITAERPVYVNGWVDIYSTTYLYKSTHPLFGVYSALDTTGAVAEYGMPGFNEDYWTTAEAIYNYCLSVPSLVAKAFAYSYNSYSLAGYIAGKTFTDGLEAVRASGKELTRSNYVDAMESKEFHVIMGDKISFQNGSRTGVESFSLIWFDNIEGTVVAKTVNSLVSLKDFKASLQQA